ncbi:MAG TPA: beta-propeller domain-containing protein [Micromonospora sp.]|nr:beta-propeller domain-containing protein [Micromonospora sp.]
MSTRAQLRPLTAGAALAAVVLAGCTTAPGTSPGGRPGAAPPFQLVSFTSCDEVLGALKSAAKAHVGCDRVSRPEHFSGATLLTVLSFDLTGNPLDNGDPIAVAADGETVYSNGRHLYVATDQRWRMLALTGQGTAPRPDKQVTEIYQFDVSGPGRPRYVTATSVPGWLLNQYAMSEWSGHLRVATTSGQLWGDNPTSNSGIYVFRADGKTLRDTGQVTGLGKGERIYAVRFVGDLGYVVTFRETDPLYPVDLRDPAAPRVAGELKIPGYSAYLHPLADGRLLGIGQEASMEGTRQGTQISLFDVADPARPTRLAQHHVRHGHSEAEHDPHAFLYWPEEQLLVVPLAVYDPTEMKPRQHPQTGALVLRVGDSRLTELDWLTHPMPENTGDIDMFPIRRSLVVDRTLWTVSEAGLQAIDLGTLQPRAWLPLT